MKKWIGYVNLFWYFASNWSFSLGLFMLYHEIRGERKYKLNTSKPTVLEELDIVNGERETGSRYEGVNYYILEKLLENIRRFTDSTTIVDLGCGKGRALVVASYYGFTQLKGVDFSKELCDEAEQNLQQLQKTNQALEYDIICDNVLNYTIAPTDSVFFLFNPFDERILTPFLEKIETSVIHYPREIFILYASPVHIDVFFQYGYEAVFRKRKLKWMDGTILQRVL